QTHLRFNRMRRQAMELLTNRFDELAHRATPSACPNESFANVTLTAADFVQEYPTFFQARLWLSVRCRFCTASPPPACGQFPAAAIIAKCFGGFMLSRCARASWRFHHR